MSMGSGTGKGDAHRKKKSLNTEHEDFIKVNTDLMKRFEFLIPGGNVYEFLEEQKSSLKAKHKSWASTTSQQQSVQEVQDLCKKIIPIIEMQKQYLDSFEKFKNNPGGGHEKFLELILKNLGAAIGDYSRDYYKLTNNPILKQNTVGEVPLQQSLIEVVQFVAKQKELWKELAKYAGKEKENEISSVYKNIAKTANKAGAITNRIVGASEDYEKNLQIAKALKKVVGKIRGGNKEENKLVKEFFNKIIEKLNNSSDSYEKIVEDVLNPPMPLGVASSEEASYNKHMRDVSSGILIAALHKLAHDAQSGKNSAAAEELQKVVGIIDKLAAKPDPLKAEAASMEGEQPPTMTAPLAPTRTAPPPSPAPTRDAPPPPKEDGEAIKSSSDLLDEEGVIGPGSDVPPKLPSANDVQPEVSSSIPEVPSSMLEVPAGKEIAPGQQINYSDPLKACLSSVGGDVRFACNKLIKQLETQTREGREQDFFKALQEIGVNIKNDKGALKKFSSGFSGLWDIPRFREQFGLMAVEKTQEKMSRFSLKSEEDCFEDALRKHPESCMAAIHDEAVRSGEPDIFYQDLEGLQGLMSKVFSEATHKKKKRKKKDKALKVDPIEQAVNSFMENHLGFVKVEETDENGNKVEVFANPKSQAGITTRASEVWEDFRSKDSTDRTRVNLASAFPMFEDMYKELLAAKDPSKKAAIAKRMYVIGNAYNEKAKQNIAKKQKRTKNVEVWSGESFNEKLYIRREEDPTYRRLLNKEITPGLQKFLRDLDEVGVSDVVEMTPVEKFTGSYLEQEALKLAGEIAILQSTLDALLASGTSKKNARVKELQSEINARRGEVKRREALIKEEALPESSPSLMGKASQRMQEGYNKAGERAERAKQTMEATAESAKQAVKFKEKKLEKIKQTVLGHLEAGRFDDAGDLLLKLSKERDLRGKPKYTTEELMAVKEEAEEEFYNVEQGMESLEERIYEKDEYAEESPEVPTGRLGRIEELTESNEDFAAHQRAIASQHVGASDPFYTNAVASQTRILKPSRQIALKNKELAQEKRDRVSWGVGDAVQDFFSTILFFRSVPSYPTKLSQELSRAEAAFNEADKPYQKALKREEHYLENRDALFKEFAEALPEADLEAAFALPIAFKDPRTNEWSYGPLKNVVYLAALNAADQSKQINAKDRAALVSELKKAHNQYMNRDVSELIEKPGVKVDVDALAAQKVKIADAQAKLEGLEEKWTKEAKNFSRITPRWVANLRVGSKLRDQIAKAKQEVQRRSEDFQKMCSDFDKSVEGLDEHEPAPADLRTPEQSAKGQNIHYVRLDDSEFLGVELSDNAQLFSAVEKIISETEALHQEDDRAFVQLGNNAGAIIETLRSRVMGFIGSKANKGTFDGTLNSVERPKAEELLQKWIRIEEDQRKLGKGVEEDSEALPPPPPSTPDVSTTPGAPPPPPPSASRKPPPLPLNRAKAALRRKPPSTPPKRAGQVLTGSGKPLKLPPVFTPGKKLAAAARKPSEEAGAKSPQQASQNKVDGQQTKGPPPRPPSRRRGQ